MEDTKLNFGFTIEQLNWTTSTISLIAEILTLFSVGCRLRTRDFEHLEKGICLGLFLQTLILPALGYLIANVFRLSIEDSLATLATSAAPVASYVGVLTYWAGGNVALSVLLSSLSTTLSIGLLPMWFLLYSQLWGNSTFITASPQDVTFYLCIIIFPAGAGMLLQNILPKFSKNLAKICSCAFLVEITLVALITAVVNPRQFDAEWRVWGAAFFLPIVAHFIGFVSAFVLRLSYEKCVAISLAIGISNSNIVISTGRSRFAAVSVDLLRLPEMYAVFAPIQGVIWALFFNRLYFINDKYPNLFGSREYDEI